MAGECNPDPQIKEVLNTEPKNLSRAAWDQEQVGIREGLSPLLSFSLPQNLKEQSKRIFIPYKQQILSECGWANSLRFSFQNHQMGHSISLRVK